ncbi:MAG: hypothetical protein PVI26_03520 [Chitinispirillia bacterium]|jgi:hypothetical protein
MVVLLDEIKSRKKRITDLLVEKGYDVKSCTGSGEFIEVIETSQADRIYMDVTSWQHGMGIFNYFKFAQKLSDIPITFYNAPENFTNILDRKQNQDDKILNKQADIVNAISEI